MNSTVKTLVFWLVIVLSAFLLWQVVRAGPETNLREISYSDFVARVESGSVATVKISRSEIIVDSRDGTRFRVVPPPGQDGMLRSLQDKKVEIWFRDTPTGSWPVQVLGTWAPLILLAVLWFYMIRTMQRRQARL